MLFCERSFKERLQQHHDGNVLYSYWGIIPGLEPKTFIRWSPASALDTNRIQIRQCFLNYVNHARFSYVIVKLSDVVLQDQQRTQLIWVLPAFAIKAETRVKSTLNGANLFFSKHLMKMIQVLVLHHTKSEKIFGCNNK